MRRSRLRVALASALVGALAGAAACVDLFHSTDFATLCIVDAAACTPDAGADDASLDAPIDAVIAIDFCKWSTAESRAHAERACAWLGACQGALPRSSFGLCMLRAEAAYDCAFNPTLRPQGSAKALWTCLANVASCAEVSACIFPGGATTCSPVPAGAFTSCSTDQPASAVVECALPEGGPPTGIEACGLERRTCVVLDPSRAVCAGKLGKLCGERPRCDGTHAVECNLNTDVGVDCATVGAGRCIEDDAGPACAPLEDAGSCSDSSRIRCDDAGIARSCVGGRAATIDCNRLGRPCAEIADSGIDPVVACTDTNPITFCTGDDECHDDDVLWSCAQGRPFEVSCSGLGLGPCQKPPAGRPQVATCTRRR